MDVHITTILYLQNSKLFAPCPRSVSPKEWLIKAQVSAGAGAANAITRN